jgi:hypothetical protein
VGNQKAGALTRFRLSLFKQWGAAKATGGGRSLDRLREPGLIEQAVNFGVGDDATVTELDATDLATRNHLVNFIVANAETASELADGKAAPDRTGAGVLIIH